MPCPKCKSDFTLLNWKIKCAECEDKYCNKCLKRKEGVLYCEVCLILIKRPPDRHKLMELRVKDLREYLNKNNISTYGLVEKKELVDLFCNKYIPEKQWKGVDKLTANFGEHLRPINGLLTNIESAFIERSGARPPTVPAGPPPTRASSATSQSHSVPTTPLRPTPRAPSASRSPPPRPPPPTPQSPPPRPPPFTPQSPPVPSSPFSPTPSAPPYDLTQDQPTTSQARLYPELTPESSPLPERYPKLSDFATVDELADLSSKQLKILLRMNRVEFKGCIEKNELLERAHRLWEDHCKNKNLADDAPLDELCKLCMDAPLDCVLLECGHITTCIECGKKLAECPICRRFVTRVVRTFKA